MILPVILNSSSQNWWNSYSWVFNLNTVDEGCLGQPRAKSICSFLQELNDAVKAKFVEETPATLIDTNPSFFSQFTVVIATQVCSSASFYELQKYDCSAVINKYRHLSVWIDICFSIEDWKKCWRNEDKKEDSFGL